MPDVLVAAYRGNLSTSVGTTLYTTPASTKFVARNIVITNTTGGTLTATVRLGGIDLLSAAPIAANGVLTVDLNQVLNAGDVIAGGASGAGLSAHISGVEVS